MVSGPTSTSDRRRPAGRSPTELRGRVPECLRQAVHSAAQSSPCMQLYLKTSQSLRRRILFVCQSMAQAIALGLRRTEVTLCVVRKIVNRTRVPPNWHKGAICVLVNSSLLRNCRLGKSGLQPACARGFSFLHRPGDLKDCAGQILDRAKTGSTSLDPLSAGRQ